MIDNIDLNITEKETTHHSIYSINQVLSNMKLTIMCINIRSMNMNFDNLKILLENLDYKSVIIVCIETYIQHYFSFFSLEGYISYYNESNIIKNDGVIIYIKSEFSVDVKIEQVGQIKVLKLA